MIRVMLSLDLIDSEDQRDDLYELIEKQNWKKLNDVDTVWTLTYPKHDHEDEERLTKIKNYIASFFKTSAKELKIKELYYVAQLGNKEVISRVVRKVDGEYKAFIREPYKKK